MAPPKPAEPRLFLHQVLDLAGKRWGCDGVFSAPVGVGKRAPFQIHQEFWWMDHFMFWWGLSGTMPDMMS